MQHEATFIPTESTSLCEHCGYNLDGLPNTGNCPECGLPIVNSTANDGRMPSLWEQNADKSQLASFVQTTVSILFHPRQFYRSLLTRLPEARAKRFANLQWILSATLLGGALAFHAQWVLGLNFTHPTLNLILLGLPCIMVIFFFCKGINALAGRLTAWEAAYRGFRLPLSVVRRTLFFHSAHLLPVSLAAFLTVAIFRILLNTQIDPVALSTRYIYFLSGLVVISAVYLFITYWTAMRSTMYANR